MRGSSGKSTVSRAEICSGLHAVAHRRSWRDAACCGPSTARSPDPRTAVPSGRRTLPASRSCDVLAQPLVGGELGRLRAARHQLGLPLRHRRPVLELAAPRRRVAAQLARDRRRRPADLPRDLPDALALGAQQGDLLALGKAQIPARTGSRSSVAIPPRSRNHRLPAAEETPTARAASSLLRPSAISRQNHSSILAPMRRLARRLHRRTPRQLLHPPSRPPIATPHIEVLRRPRESALRPIPLYPPRRGLGAQIDGLARHEVGDADRPRRRDNRPRGGCRLGPAARRATVHRRVRHARHG